MKQLTTFTIVLGMAAVLSASASAQQFKKGTLSGTVHSFASNNCPATMANLTTAAPGQAFIITEFCRDSGVQLSSTTLGTNLTSGISNPGNPGCVEITPGIAIPAGDVISCSGGGSAFVTGVAVKP